ncbi:unnamed protein product [Caenorhabditis brenneri]
MIKQKAKRRKPMEGPSDPGQTIRVSQLLQLAINSVDIGPYFCCPVWSTYGAAWSPATPFHNYVPPVPSNWPDSTEICLHGHHPSRLLYFPIFQMTANWPAAAVSVPVKARKPTKNDEEDQLPDGISSSINSWVQRQKL